MKSVTPYLNQALYHSAEPRYGSYAMGLEMEIFQRWRGQLCGLRIRCKWSFDRDKNATSATMRYISILSKGMKQKSLMKKMQVGISMRLPCLLIMHRFSF